METLAKLTDELRLNDFQVDSGHLFSYGRYNSTTLLWEPSTIKVVFPFFGIKVKIYGRNIYSTTHFCASINTDCVDICCILSEAGKSEYFYNGTTSEQRWIWKGIDQTVAMMKSLRTHLNEFKIKTLVSTTLAFRKCLQVRGVCPDMVRFMVRRLFYPAAAEQMREELLRN